MRIRRHVFEADVSNVDLFGFGQCFRKAPGNGGFSASGISGKNKDRVVVVPKIGRFQLLRDTLIY